MSLGRRNRVYDLDEARQKIRAYCSYRERSQSEVLQRLRDMGLGEMARNKLASELIQEDFLSEERFARAFVRGKFGQKGWGRIKIRQALWPHQLSDYVLNKAFEEIEEDAYRQQLLRIMERKVREYRGDKPAIRRRKMTRYCQSRGYETELIRELIREYPEITE